MFKKVLIANRGEIAVRIIRACKEWGIETVAVHSDVDSDAMHVRLADESVCIGSHQPQNSYLNISSIMSAVDLTGAEAIHPGYGFLSENSKFAEIVNKHGIKFVGPSADLISKMGDKIEAKRIAQKYGLPIIEGSEGGVKSFSEAESICKEIGYPVLIKAAGGGGDAAGEGGGGSCDGEGRQAGGERGGDEGRMEQRQAECMVWLVKFKQYDCKNVNI